MILALILLINENSEDHLAIFIIAVFLLICIPLYFHFDKAKSIEFDEEYLIISTNSIEEKISLKNIISLEKTMAQVNNRDIWKIRYRDKFNNEKSIRIWPRRQYQYFEQFKNKIIEKNPDIEIKD